MFEAQNETADPGQIPGATDKNERTNFDSSTGAGQARRAGGAAW
jgi:hypothetical protein